MNHMIHNLTPTATKVYITYDLDFIPAGSPAAAGIADVRTVWLDVTGIQPYPVFDAFKGRGGRDRRYTYPDEAPALRGPTTPGTHGRWTRTACSSAPSATCTRAACGRTSKLTRDGRSVPLFRSEAKYFEPAGAVSWDVAMTGTPPDWRVGVRRGDVLSVSATYDARRASWYESMGIMPVAFNPGGTGPDPFAVNVNVAGEVTHGPLAENRNHGGGPGGLPDPSRLLSAPAPTRRTVAVKGFAYGRGDLSRTGRRGRPPVVRPGQEPALRQPRRGEEHLPHDHRLPRALQPRHRHRLPARRRPGPLRLRQSRLRAPGHHPGGPADHVEDPAQAEDRDVHLLLPRAPVHARLVPGGAEAIDGAKAGFRPARPAPPPAAPSPPARVARRDVALVAPGGARA